jgi:hypothetical protein
MIRKIGGWGNFIGLLILFFFASYGVFKTISRNRNASYVFGISEGLKKGVRGTFRLYYRFYVEGVEYSGRVPDDFCNKCENCCKIGDTVIVEYETGNPKNNVLVTTFPDK